ncbi:DUF664 domain-containing protein [Nocardioides perillae]|uniref:Mini-circle protein n=1 Tax=Nocardioides perillae TaxID=1119534 RepID=A0A7Y9RY09_9ACTN|nr:hypothetical protein [Nocardioides perillae]
MDDRTEAPLAGDELATLTGFLDHQRDTLRLKAAGLDHDQLHTALAPSSLTLGGLLHHLAFVEHWWTTHVLHGLPLAEPWASADWDADRDWELTTAPDVADGVLRRRWEEAVVESRARVAAVVAADGAAALDRLCVHGRHDDPAQRASLRWVLVHLVEEYARHLGHADFLREALDGTTGS